MPLAQEVEFLGCRCRSGRTLATAVICSSLYSRTVPYCIIQQRWHCSSSRVLWQPNEKGRRNCLDAGFEHARVAEQEVLGLSL